LGEKGQKGVFLEKGKGGLMKKKKETKVRPAEKGANSQKKNNEGRGGKKGIRQSQERGVTVRPR